MKKIKLPKDSLVEPEQGRDPRPWFIDEGDVEGHGLPVTAPPSLGQQGPGHGGESSDRRRPDTGVDRPLPTDSTRPVTAHRPAPPGGIGLPAGQATRRPSRRGAP